MNTITIQLLLTLFLVSITQHNCEIFPIVITPKQFRFDVEEKIVIICNRNETIEVLLNDYKTQDSLQNKTLLVSKDEPVEIGLRVNKISSPLNNILLSVITESGEKKETFIELLTKSGYAFIQTDKPIYTPRENVKIRMIRLDEQLKPLKEKIKLRIKNSQKIIVEETSFTPSEPNYFVDYNFEFPPAPRLGIWFAELLYGINFTSNYTVSFELKEYVLPTFSIKIKSPKFILPSTSNISGSVQVDYVYGRPLNGSVVFKFGTKEKNGKVSYFGSTDLKVLKNGSTSYFFETVQFRQLPLTWFPVVNGFRFVVEVTVHERVTGKKDKAIDDSGLFVSSPYVISFKNAFSDFKPNVETIVNGEVLNVLGEPVPDIPVSLHLMDERGVPIKPNFISSYLNSSQLYSDHLGRISFPIILKEGVEQLHVTLRTLDPNCTRDEQAEAAHVLFAHQSQNGFISIVNKAKYSTSLSVGETYQSALLMRGAISLNQIYLIVTNLGHILYSEKINERPIKINITREMMPNIRIFVFAITRNEAIVSDSIKINVHQRHCGFDMNAEIDGMEVMPGRKVNLTLKGSKGDSVALLGVDEAVYILRNEDRLTQNKIMREVLKSDMGCGPGGGRNELDVANNAGLKLIAAKSELLNNNVDTCRKTVRVKREASNIINIYQGFLRKCCLLGMWPSNKRRNCQHKADILKTYMPDQNECYKAFFQCCRSNSGPMVAASIPRPGAEKVDFDRTRIGSGSEEYVHIAYEQDLEDKAFIRSDFRETWLFDIIILEESSVTRELTLPHSITTWSLIGMSLSPTNGLCIMPSPYRLRTFQDVFIQISLPYSVVQNEQMEMIATVFNYGAKRLAILLYFVGVDNICSEAPEAGNKAKKSLAIEANSFGTVAFPMVPLKTGTFNLKVVALWSTGSDVVIKTLTVIHPGITIEDDITFQLDPKNRQRRSKRSLKTPKLTDEIMDEKALQLTEVNLTPDYSESVILPETKECIVAGIGDSFGATAFTSLSDIDQLIRQPKGCGEQTMLYMAPTLYTMSYLEAVEKLNGDLRYRGMKYLKDGYKRILSFRKDDGSFSAFQARPSSIWLTAFVMKVLCQSRHFLKEDQIDSKVIEDGLMWLEKKQNSDGSWSELYPVIHGNSLGGVKGTLPMTAYVLITFYECYQNTTPKAKQSSRSPQAIAMERAEHYLYTHRMDIIKQKNTYAIALVAYGLSYKDVDKASDLINALHENSNSDNIRNYKYWRHEYEIEATSYALLTLLKSGVRTSVDGLSISNWLNSRRSFTGSFDTTQDTIVALEALSNYYNRRHSMVSQTYLYCNITDGRSKRSLSFNKENAQILQKFTFDANSHVLKFNTSGDGMGHISIKLKYNVLEPPEVLCKFDMDVKVSEWKSPENRENPDESQDIGDNFFGEFDNELLNSLDLKNNNNNRQKRSFLDMNSIKRAFNRYRSSTTPKPEVSDPRDRTFSNSKSESSRKRIAESKSSSNNNNNNNNNVNIKITEGQNSQTFEKNNLSSNSINSKGLSKLVLILEICVRHTPRYYSEMSLIEVGILSGYKPHKDDLEEILNVRDSLVSKYEISERNLVFYFDKVPFGKPYCLQFRKFQENIVSNSQAAVVKVYDYYHKDHSCSQLYTPTRISEYIETECNSDVCQCAKRENCPISKSLVEIGNIAEKRMVRARELFEELVCSPKYHYVFSGNFVQLNNTKHGFKLVKFNANISFKGNLGDNDSLWLRLNRECNDFSTIVGREAIIFGHSNGNTRHLNGSSIIYDITNEYKSDETRNNILDLISWLERKIRRENWKCAQLSL